MVYLTPERVYELSQPRREPLTYEEVQQWVGTYDNWQDLSALHRNRQMTQIRDLFKVVQNEEVLYGLIFGNSENFPDKLGNIYIQTMLRQSTAVVARGVMFVVKRILPNKRFYNITSGYFFTWGIKSLEDNPSAFAEFSRLYDEYEVAQQRRLSLSLVKEMSTDMSFDLTIDNIRQMTRDYDDWVNLAAYTVLSDGIDIWLTNLFSLIVENREGDILKRIILEGPSIPVQGPKARSAVQFLMIAVDFAEYFFGEARIDIVDWFVLFVSKEIIPEVIIDDNNDRKTLLRFHRIAESSNSDSRSYYQSIRPSINKSPEFLDLSTEEDKIQWIRNKLQERDFHSLSGLVEDNTGGFIRKRNRSGSTCWRGF